MAQVLNASLFEDENEYWSALTAILEDRQSYPAVPKAVRDVGSAVTDELFSAAGWSKVLKKHGRDIVESSAIGYMIVVSEDWSDLDRTYSVERMDEGLLMIQSERREKGLSQISLDDVDQRLTIMTKGLATGHPAGAPLRDYLFALPAYGRVNHFSDLLLQMGLAMAGPKSRHADALAEAMQYSWKIGVGLGLLDVMGEVPHHDRWIEPA